VTILVKKADKDINHGKLSRTPPDYLGRQAKIAWRKIVPFLEEQSNVKRPDSNLVEMYATQYEIYRNAYKHIRDHHEVQAIYKTVQNAAGEKIGTDFVGYKRNPMTSIYDSAIKNLAKVGSELGLSPKSRAELMEIIPDEKKNEGSVADQLKEFFANEN
jgi:P27 family predicted phage terminase small subunit